MKKSYILGIFLIMVSCLFLTSCGYPEEDVTFDKQSFTLVDDSDDYELVYNSLNIYYDGVVEYVNLSEFLGKLEGFVATEYVFSQINAMTGKAQYYWYTKVDENSKVISEKIIIDYPNDKITLSNYMATSCTVQSESASDAFKDIEIEVNTDPQLLPSFSLGDPIVYELSNYGFNAYFKNRTIYIPFIVANALFCSNNQQNIYLDKVNKNAHFVDYDLSDSKSSMKNAYFETEQTVEFREYNLNSFEFIMDYFYGLKNYKNIDSFKEYFSDYKTQLLSTDPLDNLAAYRAILLTKLNDMHTRLGNVSFYTDNKTVDNWNVEYCGTKRLRYKEVTNLLKDKYQAADLTTYVKTDEVTVKYKLFNKMKNSRVYDIIVIYFDYFLDGVSDKIYNLLQSYPDYNHVIFDLSLNGGGYNTELFKLVGMGSKNFKYITHRLGSNAILPANVSVPTRFMNLDIACITSECSFSCGNIMPSYISNRLGQVTGGGMCAVIPYVIADGTTIELSGHNAVYSPNNTPIEDGVEATTLIPYDDFFNYDKIINDYYLA